MMADDLRNRGHRQISLSEPWEVDYWTNELGVSKGELERLHKEGRQFSKRRAPRTRQPRQASLIRPNRKICFGIGWVCENHPDRAWDEQLDCLCGAGGPCICNKTDGVDEPDVSQLIVDPRFHRKINWERFGILAAA
jgi:hypothetical protein